MNPKVYCGLWVTVICGMAWSLVTNVPSGGDADDGKCYVCVGAEVCGISLYLPLNFVVNFKGL